MPVICSIVLLKCVTTSSLSTTNTPIGNESRIKEKISEFGGISTNVLHFLRTCLHWRLVLNPLLPSPISLNGNLFYSQNTFPRFFQAAIPIRKLYGIVVLFDLTIPL